MGQPATDWPKIWPKTPLLSSSNTNPSKKCYIFSFFIPLAQSPRPKMNCLPALTQAIGLGSV